MWRSLLRAATPTGSAPAPWRDQTISRLSIPMLIAILTAAVLILGVGLAASMPLTAYVAIPVAFFATLLGRVLPVGNRAQASLIGMLVGMIGGGFITGIELGYVPGVVLAFLVPLITASTLGNRLLAHLTAAAIAVAFFASGTIVALSNGSTLVAEMVETTNPQVWLRIGIVTTVFLAIPLFFIGTVRRHFARSHSALEQAVAEISREQGDREQAEQDRTALEQVLEDSHKAAAIGQVATGVAHEYANQLLVVMAWTDLLKERRARQGLLAREELATALAPIQRAIAQSTRLTHSLLALRKEHPQWAGLRITCNIDQAIHDHLATLEVMLPEDITVHFTGEAAAPVTLTEHEIGQVLISLALNARDALPTGGQVDLRTRRDGEAVVLEVADNGTGMSAEILERIFDHGFTTRKAKGSGIGLALVRLVVEAAGGQITASTTEGQGTVFRIRLPIAERDAAAPAHADRPTAELSPLTILLVEDDEAVRRVLERMLKSRGHEALLASDGDAALELCRRHHGRIDLLLIDAIIPGRSSRSVIEHFRALFPESPILLCSGHVEDELLRRGIDTSEYALLEKPFTGKQLDARLAEVFAPRTRHEEAG